MKWRFDGTLASQSWPGEQGVRARMIDRADERSVRADDDGLILGFTVPMQMDDGDQLTKFGN